MRSRQLKFAFDRRYLVELLSAALRSKVLLALLLVDLTLIVVHVAVIGFARGRELPESALWVRLDEDRSLAEIIEYLKGITAGVLLLRLSLAKSPALIPVALLPLYLVLDNALRIHELTAMTLFPGRQNKGELAVSMGIGALMGVAALFAFIRANARERAAIVAVGVGIVAIGVMAAGVDVIHLFGKRYDFYLGRVLGIAEDGGELIAQSLLLAICVAVWKHPPAGGAARTEAGGEASREGQARSTL